MQTIKSFLDQSIVVWKDSTAAARFGIILLLILCVGAIVGVGVWSAQPHYVTLASNLDHVKSTQLMAALDQADIGYQIKGAGSIIQVDKRYFDRASVLAGNHGIGSDEAELEIASPWMDPVNQQNVYRRNLERQLANSIQKFASIESATVHLSIPERQPFLRQSDQPTAAVVLRLSPKSSFNEAHAAAISSLVANAVPGLRMDQVAISDTSGNLYSNDESMGRLTMQEEYRVNRERELTNKAQALLVNFLGIGNSRVEITADFSFPEGKTTTTEFDPDKRVATSETIDSSTSTTSNNQSLSGDSAVAAGLAGTASNVGNGRRAGGDKSLTSKTETLNSQYEVSSTLREDIVRTPILNLLTVSVLVNSSKVQNDAQEIPPSVKTSIEALIKQAVGFRENTDQFNLEFFEFVELMPIEDAPATAIPWEQINSVLKNLSLGVAALIALFFGLKTVRSLQPAPGTGTAGAGGGNESGSQVGQLSEMVKQNPEVFSKIIAAWASESQAGSGETAVEKAA